jgi:threonine/homoserine/homoserine lactone efflux protein
MLDPERLAAFALMTAATSVVPGVSMLFVVGRTIRNGWRSGAAALAGMQLGYIGWWLLAAFGLATLALAFPLGFRALTVLGALYLAWLGVRSLRDAGRHGTGDTSERSPRRGGAFRDGVLVALSNPKSLIYIVALLPPFIDPRQPVVPQLVVLALVAMAIDVAVGVIYIAMGSRLAAAMARPATRTWFDRAVGVLFIAIALAILADIASR